MTLKPLRIIAVGRLRTPFWKEAAAHYRNRIVRWRTLEETVIKDADPARTSEERRSIESRAILAALTPKDLPICLDERGKTYTSPDFARFLERLSENANRTPCFILGGAFGLDESVRAAAHSTMAFGALTLPHELARVVLFEQLYRAESLLRNMPYHH